MGEYSYDIDTDLYNNIQPVYVTEITGTRQTFIPLKLSLNQSNFNFAAARSDGLDFRLAERSNGTGVLQMWVAYWSAVEQQATLWFKLPELLAGETRTLWAIWGYEYDTGISSLDDLMTDDPVFLFADDFNLDALDETKWEQSAWPQAPGGHPYSNISVNGGALRLYYEGTISPWIQCTPTLPLDGVRSWIVEEGVEGEGSPTSTTLRAHGYQWYGGDNEFGIYYFWEGATDREHNFTEGGSFAADAGEGKGLEIGSYSNNYVAYVESTDRIYQGMSGRTTAADYDDDWERSVHRNTQPTYFRILGPEGDTSEGLAIQWVVAREYTPSTDPTVDYSELYVDYGAQSHQTIDTLEYGSDVTSVDFYHSSDMGGDPYRMSDNVTSSISNIFISDTATTSGNIIIDFGRGSSSITDKDYIHFDNNHVQFYAAAKLSDLDDDEHSRDYWLGTTSSGWAAIQFPDAVSVGCLALNAVPSKLNGMVQNFKFYGSNSDPRFSGWDDKVLLYEGVCQDITTEQPFYFNTANTLYTYYILEVVDTFGDDIAIQEWGMYELTPSLGKKVISQLRLHPVAFSSQEEFHVKEIELHGSNDGINWTPLLFRTDTPYPFSDYIYGRWSRHSFNNFDSYYAYKLVCIGDWGSNNQIKMAEWEMVERIEEASNYRILSGSTNNMNNVWAEPDTTISSGTLYITNENFNTVSTRDNNLIEYSTVSGIVSDFNVK